MNKVTNILNKPHLILAFISLLGIYQLAFQFNYSQPNSIAGDGVGYYQYLPNTFLNQNLDSQIPDARFIQEIEGKGVNKYYVGTAVSTLPFFGLGHLIAKVSVEKTDGFSWPYHWAISFAGLLFLLGGLLFLIRFLGLFGFSRTILSFTLLLLVFGTNLFAYAYLMPSMSHVHSFFWITGFLFFSKNYLEYDRNNQLFWAMFFLGFVILVRPINGIVIFATPFLVGSFSEFKKVVSSVLGSKKGIVSLLILMIILIIQPVFWYLQSGEFMVWSYGDEGFNFTQPQWLEFLFGFRKGALVYTPVLFFSIAGLGIFIRKKTYQGMGLLVFFVLLIYVLSSWWNWYYGPSFSQRPLIEFYGLSFLFVASFLNQIKLTWARIGVGMLALFFILLNLIQTYQYHNGIISSWDMNWKKYQYSFLKVSSDFQNSLGGNDDIMLYAAKTTELAQASHDFDFTESSSFDYTGKEFGWEQLFVATPDFLTRRGIYVQVDLELNDLQLSKQNAALFVVEIQDSTGNNRHYYTFPIRSIPPTKEGWKSEHYQIELPKLRQVGDRLKLYIWNKENESFWIDNINLKVIGVN